MTLVRELEGSIATFKDAKTNIPVAVFNLATDKIKLYVTEIEYATFEFLALLIYSEWRTRHVQKDQLN